MPYISEGVLQELLEDQGLFDDEEKKSKKGKVSLEMEEEMREEVREEVMEEGPSFSGIFTSTTKPEELERLLPKVC